MIRVFKGKHFTRSWENRFYPHGFIMTKDGKVGTRKLVSFGLGMHLYSTYNVDTGDFDVDHDHLYTTYYKIYADAETEEEAILMAQTVEGLKAGSKSFFTKLALIADQLLEIRDNKVVTS